MSELNGQMDLNNFLPEEPGKAEGYDAEGRLMDYEAESPTGADAPPSHCDGEAMEAQTSAEMTDTTARLNVLAAEVRAIEDQVKGVALSGAVAIGKRLLEAKGLVPHGRFCEWLRLNVDYSERRAQDLMRLYETYGRGTIPESVNALDYSKAVALLSAPEEAREAPRCWRPSGSASPPTASSAARSSPKPPPSAWECNYKRIRSCKYELG